MKTTYFKYLFISLYLVLLGCNSYNQNPKPNVLFILADDLGYHDLSVTGSNYYETPHIDRIANEGTQFLQGYAASRVCSPSRASIFSGQFTSRHGITDWIGARSGVEWRKANRHDLLLPAAYVHQFPAEYTSLAEAFLEGGYRTFFAGKWHLGSEGSYPEDHGFEINIGGWDKGSPIGGYFDPYKNPKLPNRQAGENLSMRLALETNDFIQAHQNQPFFAFLSFYAVHGPIQTTPDKWKKYRDKAYKAGVTDSGFVMERVLPIRQTQDNPIYAGLVEAMDDAVGVVLQKLDELGLAENTIVVFTSDNGGVASGDAFSTSNLPLRGGKGYQWEGGIREPFFIKTPMLTKTISQCKVPVSGIDFYPTLIDLAGIQLTSHQTLDGVSLSPLLTGDTIPDRPLFWHYPHYGNQGGHPSSIIRHRNWKLIHYWENGNQELYHLSDDPGESKDLGPSNPQIVNDLAKKLFEFLEITAAKTPMIDTLYDPIKAQERHQHILNSRWPALEAQRRSFLKIDFSPNADWWGSKVTSD